MKLTRMDQQAWKRELEREANNKNDEDGEGDGDEPPSKKRKPRAKGKAKAKAKSKSKGGPRKKSHPKKSVKAEAKSEVLVTPPPKESKARESLSSKRKMKEEDLAGKAVKKQKATFARRYRPKTSTGAALWDALMAAFASVAYQFEKPSKLEAYE